MKKRGTRQETEEWLWDEFEKIKAKGQPTGPTAFAKHIGVDRTYLYRFPSFVAELSAYGKQTQPSVSGRGVGLSKTEAKKREIDARVRREHTQWSVEISELSKQLKDAKDEIAILIREKRDLSGRLKRTRRLCELLLLLASEAGVSPVELEKIQAEVMKEQAASSPASGRR
jgi:hypothetical protein